MPSGRRSLVSLGDACRVESGLPTRSVRVLLQRTYCARRRPARKTTSTGIAAGHGRDESPGARAQINELQRVGLVLLHHHDAAATDPRQLVRGLLEELRLDVVDPDRDVGGEFLELALDERRGHVVSG